MGIVNNLFNMEGRVALVTGASSWGIGSVSAKYLADAGAKVFLVARREEKLKERVAEIEEAGGTATYFACDVASEESCKAAVDACLAKFGQLDVMVLSHGISGLPARTLEDDFDSENYRNLLGINLDGCFWMMKHGHEACAESGHGSIVVVSSLGAYTGDGSASYTAAKGALRSLMTHFGKRLAAENVRINGVYPGFVDTDMTHMGFSMPEVVARFTPKIPLQRFGQPEDIAAGVLYLACDASAWVTGQHLIIDGGQACYM